MGLFSKVKQGMAGAATAAEMANAHHNEQAAGAAQGKIGVAGMGANPAAFGGPSTTPLAPDDPLLAPVDGLSLEMYGTASAEAQRRGVTDEDGMAALIEEMHGVPAATAKAAMGVWIQRMGQSMVVGQQLRKYMGY